MYGVPTEVPAAERARWLAELSVVLNEAHDLVQRWQFNPQESGTAKELFLRIEAARLEVESLRLSRSLNSRHETGPKWMESEAWLPPQLSAR